MTKDELEKAKKERARKLLLKKNQYLKKLGAHIKLVREAQNFSQDRVYLEGDLSRATMSRIESGAVDPQAFTLHRIAKTIGVPVKKLLDFE